jgi:hypothetical protein
MRYWCTKALICAGLLLFSQFLRSGEAGARSLSPVELGECHFSIREINNLRLANSSYGSTEGGYCWIGLKSLKRLHGDTGDIAVLIQGKRWFDSNQDQGKSGFWRAQNGHWMFKGTELLLSPEMLNTSFTEERSGNETLLVGYQLIKGNIAQGGPISVPGIRILRITPEFVVSVELNFQPLHYEKQNKGYKQLREAVSRELVDIVRSVQFTPGAPGPTLRSNSAP